MRGLWDQPSIIFVILTFTLQSAGGTLAHQLPANGRVPHPEAVAQQNPGQIEKCQTSRQDETSAALQNFHRKGTPRAGRQDHKAQS